jgi:hypothetical protein
MVREYRLWTPEEEAFVATGAPHGAFVTRFGAHRTSHSYHEKRKKLGMVGQPHDVPLPPSEAVIPPLFFSDKKLGEFSWRDANRAMRPMQDFKERASSSQDEALLIFDTDKPLDFICLSDTHIGSWATDHDAFERLTDEILASGLYVALIGDVQDMAIKLRNVMEVQGSLLSAELQHRYVESWLEEIAPRVLFSTWDNHSVMREEAQAGSSRYADLMKRRVIWHNHIGHPDVTVGGETYRLAVSHFFRGRSIENPCHGAMRYMRREGIKREIAIAGDSHVPGIVRYVDGDTWRMAVNCGTLQLGSGYGKRFFGLAAQPVFPVVRLWPDRHLFTAFWNLDEWKRAVG